MYQQILYQVADKLTNTLQNNKTNPVDVLMFLTVAGAVIGSAYMIHRELNDIPKQRRMGQYKTK